MHGCLGKKSFGVSVRPSRSSRQPIHRQPPISFMPTAFQISGVTIYSSDRWFMYGFRPSQGRAIACSICSRLRQPGAVSNPQSTHAQLSVVKPRKSGFMGSELSQRAHRGQITSSESGVSPCASECCRRRLDVAYSRRSHRPNGRARYRRDRRAGLMTGRRQRDHAPDHTTILNLATARDD